MTFTDGVQIEASSAKTATGNGATQEAGAGAKLSILLDCTAVSGTSPTLTLSVQWSLDGGTTWADADPADAFAAITAAAKKAKAFDRKGSHYRLLWTIGGTTPSFTFSARASAVA